MSLPDLLDALLRAHGPSGHEHLAFDAVRAGAAAIAGAAVETDAVGNVVVRRAGRGGGPLLALYAHLDVIGLAVAHVRDDGLLSVHTLGTWRAAIGYGQRVAIATRTGFVPGVVVAATKDDEKREWGDLLVDVGARDGDDARALVRPGDPVVVDVPPLELANGRVAARSLDNRVSVYVALEALRRLAQEPPAADVAVVASAHEELGHAGAFTATHTLRPDVALVLDVTYATDVPGTDPEEAGDHRLGGGPAIFRGPAVSPLLFDLLVATADEEGIAHTIEVGAKTYTDADHTHLSRGGVATAVVSVPLRNMHSPIEVVDLEDVEACVRLVAAFARRLEPGLDLRR
ncbi:MAG TPA: M20/M25/M40 family metallo-hydrolase [Gaiellaceae bacterium]|jgi:endoglucanase|nr:M20/M25/M40 family metallo-hydrolase [Gaiellaceae bacterium]